MEGLVTRRNTRSIKKKPEKNFYFQKLIKSRYFPLICCYIVIGLSFVLVRMKRIEQDYAYNEISHKLINVNNKIKELKANKAQLLSIKNLRKISKRYKLKEPDHKHIIIIP